MIDIWKGVIYLREYQPKIEDIKDWFRMLREIAPMECLAQIFFLSYSQLI
ncbi:MAG: hypothetical protein ACFFB0_07725 [Promethearchaeota archaeon]